MSAVHRRAASALLLACAMAGGGAHALTADKLYTLLAPSVWRVFAFDEQGRPFSQGSGVVIARESVVTNCHVLARAKSIQISQGGVSVLAKLRYIDLERDLCQLTARGLHAPVVQVGDSGKLLVGQKIYTLGNPINMELTLSDGIISSMRRDDDDRLRYIQISAPISHGSSGGGLFDEDGKLIGITSASVEAGQNLNLAIPIAWLAELPRRSTTALAKYQAKTPRASADAAPATTPTPAPAPTPAPEQGPAPAPARPSTPAPVASGYAELYDVEKLLKLNPHARKTYENFLTRPLPRAFAISLEPGSRQIQYSWKYGRVAIDPSVDPDPALRVVPLCERQGPAKCVLYAVDNVVVYKAAPNTPTPSAP